MVITKRILAKKQTPPALNLHIEPKSPIELEDMLASLAAIGRRFQSYSRNELHDEFGRDPKLFVSSIKPGSIDISLIPDLLDVGKTAAGAVAAVGAGDAIEAVKGFAGSISTLLNIFKKPVAEKDQAAISIKDCDDAINIVKPIATSGGTQNFNVTNIRKQVVLQFSLASPAASKIIQHATERKVALLEPAIETRKSVALVWQKIDKSVAKTEGANSPDKARIEEIDRSAKSILFAEDMSGVKAEMMADPMLQMVYYVDVHIITVHDKIKAYRVVGYHGKEAIDDDESA